MFCQIQPLTSADLPGCLALARDRGWLPEERKWRLLFDLAVVYGVRDPPGELAGVAVLTRYGTEFAVIGMMLVATRYGGRGLGRALMNRALADVGDAIVFLHATPAGRALYEKLGFVPAGASHTYLGGFRPAAPAVPAAWAAAASATAVPAASAAAASATAAPAPAAAAAAGGGSRPAGPGDLMAIRRLDARANGTDRALLVRRLPGGSALSASSIWSFGGTNVAHWNGSTWTRTSVASLLPAKQELNDPAVVGIDAQSKDSVYAIGSGNLEDEGGPTVILHYNGHSWAKVAEGSFGVGTSPLQQVASDGHGGLWLPMPAVGGERSYLVHYASGRLTAAALPTGPRKINVESIAHIPGTAQVLAGGFTHASDNPGAAVVAVLLQYERG